MNSTKQTNKFTRFLRNNAALLLIIFCVIAITTVVLVVTLTGEKPADDPTTVVPDPNPDDPTGGNTPKEPIKVYFSAPLEYSAITMEFSDGKEILFVYNSTLDTWATHKAVDLKAADGAAVSAMYDGTVLSVENTYSMGNVVKIDHGDKVIATYASLGDVSVVKGQAVKKGDKIGTAGTTASYEFADGAHVHLEIAVNGLNVDPMPYVKGEIFREVTED